MNQQNRVIIDINICKLKEVFLHFFVHFLCNAFLIYFNPFLSEKYFFPTDVNFIKKIHFNKECFLTARDEMFNWF